MTNIIELTDNVIGVRVPKGKTKFKHRYSSLFTESGAEIYIGPNRFHTNWQIIALSTEITEEQAEEIVDQHFDTGEFKEYLLGFYQYQNAIESFQSLLKSKGIQEPVLILKREEDSNGSDIHF